MPYSSKEDRVREAIKRKKEKQRKKILWFSLLIAAVISVILAVDFLPSLISRRSWHENARAFTEKIAILENVVFHENDIYDFLSDLNLSNQQSAGYITFISVTDTKERAKVITGTGDTPEKSWEKAVSITEDYILNGGMKPVWIKADIVDSVEKISAADFPDAVRPFRSEFFRKGISLDKDFETAFMETQVNGNKLIDYDSNSLDKDNINSYLSRNSRERIEVIPEEIWLFTTAGWFCDENDNVYELYGYGENGYNKGRRVIDEFGRDKVEEVIKSASVWLNGEINDDGSFIYGYYPTYDRQFTAYNMLRHAVSIQPLIWYNKMTGTDELLPGAKATIEYLTKDHVGYKSEGVAYIIDRPNSEVKLGGNALAIITLELYMRTYENDTYKQLCIDLGNGILELMDPNMGTFFHVLNLDFSPKDEFRTVYYDGESAYALTLLYEMTGDDKWLEAAKAAVENFIREDYTRYRDHWVAYAMNEITKHYDDQRYYEFALRNVQENLDAIYYRDTSFHTYLELLMASFMLYDRIMENDIQVDYLEEFDHGYFIDTIFHRAEHMLNGFIYPEYAMYLMKPYKITGSFFIRHDGYRIRIDDVEHFIAGYYNFWKHYEKLNEYRKEYFE